MSIDNRIAFRMAPTAENTALECGPLACASVRTVGFLLCQTDADLAALHAEVIRACDAIDSL